jgi:hypothetical protein
VTPCNSTAVGFKLPPEAEALRWFVYPEEIAIAAQALVAGEGDMAPSSCGAAPFAPTRYSAGQTDGVSPGPSPSVADAFAPAPSGRSVQEQELERLRAEISALQTLLLELGGGNRRLAPIEPAAAAAQEEKEEQQHQQQEQQQTIAAAVAAAKATAARAPGPAVAALPRQGLSALLPVAMASAAGTAPTQRRGKAPGGRFVAPPRAIFKLVLNAIETHGMLQQGDRVLLCISGGKVMRGTGEMASCMARAANG